MDTTNENICQLLEMLDNPDAYTEQEILDIINRDEDTRETYRLMVAAKRSSRHRRAGRPIDVEAAWKRFCENEELKMNGEGDATAHPTAQHNFQFSIFNFQFRKVAASFVGVLLVSGIAFAAIRIVRQQQTAKALQAADTTIVESSSSVIHRSSLTEDSVAMQPIIYDNIPLEKMLPEIAAHYGAKVIFANDEVRGLRFRFVWNPQQGIDQIVSDLNQFKRLTVTRKGDQITVE